MPDRARAAGASRPQCRAASLGPIRQTNQQMKTRKASWTEMVLPMNRETRFIGR
jgi:hypothetical protein